MRTEPIAGAGPDATFRSAIDEGRFILQYCGACRQHVFYPRLLCPRCGSPELAWRPASGRGTVYSTTTVRQQVEQGGPYNVSLIALEEGPRLMSRVVTSAPDDVRIGMPVSAYVGREDNAAVLLFRPAEDHP